MGPRLWEPRKPEAQVTFYPGGGGLQWGRGFGSRGNEDRRLHAYHPTSLQWGRGFGSRGNLIAFACRFKIVPVGFNGAAALGAAETDHPDYV